MNVACLDLAYRNIGVCFGVIEQGKFTPKKLAIIETPQRKTKKNISITDFEDTQRIAKELQKIIKKQDLVIFELPGGSQSARAARVLGYVIGLMAWLKKVNHVSPSQVKKVVRTRASKDEIIEWSMKKHPELNWGDFKKSQLEHVSDAICVGYAWLNLRKP